MSNELMATLIREKMTKDKLSFRRAGDQVGVSHTTIQRAGDGEQRGLGPVHRLLASSGLQPTQPGPRPDGGVSPVGGGQRRYALSEQRDRTARPFFDGRIAGPTDRAGR